MEYNGKVVVLEHVRKIRQNTAVPLTVPKLRGGRLSVQWYNVTVKFVR